MMTMMSVIVVNRKKADGSVGRRFSLQEVVVVAAAAAAGSTFFFFCGRTGDGADRDADRRSR